MALIQHGAQIGAAKLWYDKPHKVFYLLVALEIEGADPTSETYIDIAGVDVGVRYLVVTSDTRGKSTFYSGKGMVFKAISMTWRERLNQSTKPTSMRKKN